MNQVGWAPAAVLALNGHSVPSLPRLHGLLTWLESKDWSMPPAKGFFLSKSEAQTFKNPVLKYLPQGPPKAVTVSENRTPKTQGNCPTLLRKATASPVI